MAVPPKYNNKDFTKASYWQARGKLDVPKERFVSYPHSERAADASPVVGWAGWSRLELAQATAAYYLEMKEQEGCPADRLTPLLLALIETLKDVDPEKVLVEDAMSTGVYTVSPDSPIDEVVSEMAAKKYGSAVVLQNNRVVGIFTNVDVCTAFSELLHSRLAK